MFRDQDTPVIRRFLIGTRTILPSKNGLKSFKNHSQKAIPKMESAFTSICRSAKACAHSADATSALPKIIRLKKNTYKRF